MQERSPSSALARSPIVPVAAGAIALAIFVVDTATSLDIAIAVLYVVVVLMAANFLQQRGVLLVASACLFSQGTAPRSLASTRAARASLRSRRFSNSCRSSREALRRAAAVMGA